MFDFEKLTAYHEIRSLNRLILPELFKLNGKNPYLVDQMKRSSLSTSLNLAEGVGRSTGPDKKQFYIRARSSIFETVAILHAMEDLGIWEKDFCAEIYLRLEKISKLILGMIRALKLHKTTL